MNKQGIAGPALVVVLAAFLAVLVGVYELAKKDLGPTTATTTPVVTDTTPTEHKTMLTLHFRDMANIANDCAATYEVKREIAPTPRVADAALKILFAENLTQLKDSYRSVKIVDGIATIDFTRDALEYLNAPACEQISYTVPIRDTLQEFPTVKEIRYSIDGVLKTEWDA